MMDDNVSGFVSHEKEHAGGEQEAARPKSGKRQGALALTLVLLSVFLAAGFIAARTAGAQTSIQTTASTQLLFGEDALDGDQNILAQYMRINVTPEGKNIAVSGYGRLWKDFGAPAVQTDNGTGRLYYLYLDYAPSGLLSFRAGRQWVNYTAGSAVLDGLTANLDLSKASRLPIGISLSGGSNVFYTLDGEDSRSGNLFFAGDVHLVNSMLTKLGLSYVQTYDNFDRAQQEFGLNFRRLIGAFSPYGEARYNLIDNLIDEAELGVDYFPSLELMLKGEYYYINPTFDATDFYSVFAVDKYQEGLFQADYNLEHFVPFPMTVFGSYTYQAYGSGDGTSYMLKAGATVSPVKKLTLTGDVNSQEGYDGHLIGFEIDGDYRPTAKLQVSGGWSFQTFKRPVYIVNVPFTDVTDLQGYSSANSFWLGANYKLRKSLTVGARLEEDIDPLFSHATEGRLVLNYQI